MALGLLVAPYTLAYAAALVLVAVPWLATRRPRWTMAFALISPIMIPISLTAWAAGLIMLAAATPDQPRPGSLMDGEPTHRGADSEAGSAPDGLPVALASLRR